MAVSARKGDRISVDSQKAGEPAREGVILEVIRHEYGDSYRVRWDDGHESTFRPTAGTVHTSRERRPRADETPPARAKPQGRSSVRTAAQRR